MRNLKLLRRQRMFATQQALSCLRSQMLILCLRAALCVRCLRKYYKNLGPRAPIINRDIERNIYLHRLFDDNDIMCHSQLRMRRQPFKDLVERLRIYGLRDSRFLSAEEQVAIFLAIVGHDHRYSGHVCNFYRSSETISKYFHLVLNCILRMYNDIVKPASTVNSPDEGSCRRPWKHYFKDAIGAIDGTHFLANVPAIEQPKYRNRHATITQNVLVACDFDMNFTYVLAGWEGSAHDGRVLDSAITREGKRLTLPEGKYYLGDAGFPLVKGILTPYRGVRYHLREHAGTLPSNSQELFNYRHSVLRNVVERTIGLLKKRFAFLRGHTFHSVTNQAKIILACCALHNYLREVDYKDRFLEDEEELNDDNEFRTEPFETQTKNEWTDFRDNLAERMWNELDQYNADDDEGN